MEQSLSQGRMDYKPLLSPVLSKIDEVFVDDKGKTLHLCHGRGEAVPPLKVGVVYSGGPASGGMNVIVGLLSALKALNPKCKLYGFVGGPSGVLEQKYIDVEEVKANAKINTGGFDFLGSGRTKIETEEQFQMAMKTIDDLGLHGLVFIGGDDTNTNAALLAKYVEKQGRSVSIVGIPKTIDGDLQTEHVEISFGFDTACRVYSEMIGNICIDAVSSRKYWHCVKVMGRTASHVALECALQTQPNITLVGEEVRAKNLSLNDLVKVVADIVEKRAKAGKKYGVMVIPEGLIEFIPTIGTLIQELNRLIAQGKGPEGLSSTSKEVYSSLPAHIQEQLLADRDSHGNVQLAKIETEKLISELVIEELAKRGGEVKMNAIHHYLGYEGRCSYPSNFDANYCYNLGYIAAVLIKYRKNGYMAAVRNLKMPTDKWEPLAVRISDMLVEEERKGEKKMVIQKALVDLDGKAYHHFLKHRNTWGEGDLYISPGPIQFWGPGNDQRTNTLRLRKENSPI